MRRIYAFIAHITAFPGSYPGRIAPPYDLTEGTEEKFTEEKFTENQFSSLTGRPKGPDGRFLPGKNAGTEACTLLR